VKLKELRKAAEEKLAAEEAARIAGTNPKNLLRKARVVLISSDSSFFEEVQLQNALRKRKEFDAWQMAIVDGWGNEILQTSSLKSTAHFSLTHSLTR
jgi:hypothetical protein